MNSVKLHDLILYYLDLLDPWAPGEPCTRLNVCNIGVTHDTTITHAEMYSHCLYLLKVANGLNFSDFDQYLEAKTIVVFVEGILWACGKVSLSELTLLNYGR